MNEVVLAAFLRELNAFSLAEKAGDFPEAWSRLERAHILGQDQALSHLRAHLSMAAFALRRHDLRELIGQIPRILLAVPGSWTGRAPQGNTGGANVGIFEPMKVPDDVASVLIDQESMSSFRR